MKRILYIGEFPPPVGGVTIKNDLLKKYVFTDMFMEFYNLYDCKNNVLNIFSLIKKILCATGFIIGVGSNKRLTCLLQLIKVLKGKNKLTDCIIFMMGSTLQDYCKSHLVTTSLLKEVKCIYTESFTINNQFNVLGINNTKYFPNCRIDLSVLKEKHRSKGEPLKLLFFSKICEEKGVDILFSVLDEIQEVNYKITLDFYGIIAPLYQEKFKKSIKKYEKKCRYCGVFKSSEEDIYTKLHEYDLLLFPSTWKGEGVAGILVESKMAGIPCIVTDNNFNKEVVADKQEGIVISGNLIYGFKEAILKLYEDETYYNSLATGAYLSRKRYDISRYRSELRNNFF